MIIYNKFLKKIITQKHKNKYCKKIVKIFRSTNKDKADNVLISTILF